MRNNPQYVFFFLALLCCMTIVHASPAIVVDPRSMVCDHERCYNSTLISDGLHTIPESMTPGLRLIHVVHSCGAPHTSYRVVENGTIEIFDCWMNVTQYTGAVRAALADYAQHPYNPVPVKHLRYPVPSWMPRPGQCDMGVRVLNSRGQVVCVR